MVAEQGRAIQVFLSHAHEDEALCQDLVKHFSGMRRQGLLKSWYHYDIQPGQERQKESKEHLEDANIILLLISSDFLASDYCDSYEVKQAIERHRNGTACVIPILLRPADWTGSLFS